VRVASSTPLQGILALGGWSIALRGDPRGAVCAFLFLIGGFHLRLFKGKANRITSGCRGCGFFSRGYDRRKGFLAAFNGDVIVEIHTFTWGCGGLDGGLGLC